MNINQLENLRLEMIESKKRFDQSLIDFSLENCGVKIGDIIVVNGYAHKGKQMRVTSVHGAVDLWKKEYFAVLQGSVLKNDGSESKNTGETKIPLGCAN